MGKICSIEGCGIKHYGLGYCHKHWKRLKMTGSTETSIIVGNDEARMWSKILVTDGCWIWTGTKFQSGYGLFSHDRKNKRAHRYVYEFLIGKISDRMTIDHICLNKLCVNPDHLEVVTARENIIRGHRDNNPNRRKMHCPQGHPYSGENLYVSSDGWRQCLQCRRIRSIKYNKTHRRNKNA